MEWEHTELITEWDSVMDQPVMDGADTAIHIMIRFIIRAFRAHITQIPGIALTPIMDITILSIHLMVTGMAMDTEAITAAVIMAVDIPHIT